jgi:hypothetical protein
MVGPIYARHSHWKRGKLKGEKRVSCLKPIRINYIRFQGLRIVLFALMFCLLEMWKCQPFFLNPLESGRTLSVQGDFCEQASASVAFSWGSFFLHFLLSLSLLFQTSNISASVKLKNWARLSGIHL